MSDPAAAGSISSFRDCINQPIFIVSTPRSGSTLLFETVAQSPGLFSISGESHFLIEGLVQLSTPNRGWQSNRLTAGDASPDVVEQLARRFYEALRNREGRRAEGRVRMLEKTPKNALRVEFFAAAWPDSRFVYLYRDPRETLASMMEAWGSGRFRTYPTLPGWTGYPWSLLLVPGWREFNGKSLPEIVARQWATTVEILVQDLEKLSPPRIFPVRYDEFLRSPQATMEKLTKWAGLDWDRKVGSDLPLSKFTVTRPRADKWRQVEGAIEQVFPIVADADSKARRFIDPSPERPAMS